MYAVVSDLEIHEAVLLTLKGKRGQVEDEPDKTYFQRLTPPFACHEVGASTPPILLIWLVVRD